MGSALRCSGRLCGCTDADSTEPCSTRVPELSLKLLSAVSSGLSGVVPSFVKS